jgi:FkbM family methyltransferase
MIKRMLKRFLHGMGWELRRLPNPRLPRRHTTEFDGQPLSLWLANTDTDLWWGKPVIPMNAEYAGLKELCHSGDTVLDVGAHHGMMTILFARKVGPHGRVHSIEANPFNAMVLQANVGLNQLTNVDCVHTAIGRAVGTVVMEGESVGGGGGLPQSVALTTLDQLCRDRSIRRVDVLKVDVEGFELDVFHGAREVLAQRPRIALELHLDFIRRFGGSVADLVSLLDLPRRDYKISAMIRPAWDAVRPLESLSELPETGVVNLFFDHRTSG